jgi:hypothetical protein
MSRAKWRLFFTISTTSLALVSLGLHAQSSAPRVQAASIVRLGTFRVPSDIHAGGQANAGFEYGGTALGFNPARNSLFVTGHTWDQLTGEIGIPSLGGTATLLQTLADSVEGKLGQINPGDPNSKIIGGNLVWGTKLIVSGYSYYDGNGTQVVSHFSRSITLSTKGQVSGPVRVGPLGAGFYSGYMGTVPAEWQSAFGGPALTGNADLGVISRTSFGPAVFAFNPDTMTSTGAQPLVYYPEAHPTLGPWSGANQYYGGADTVKGVVFPAGTSTVLFFGRHGGTFCYGVGTSNQSLAGTRSPNGVDPYCYDPDDNGKGVHGYPYSPYVWAYDANELASVHAGQRNPWDVRPYAVWALPGMGAQIGGAAYDPATKRIYVSQMFGDGDNPLVHVFNVTVGTATTNTPPHPPSNVRIVR